LNESRVYLPRKRRLIIKRSGVISGHSDAEGEG
jgi:hypothetical protein